MILVYIYSIYDGVVGGGGGHNWQFIMAGQLIRLWVRGLLCMKALTFSYIHCKKKVSGFPVTSRDVTDQTLPGRE